MAYSPSCTACSSHCSATSGCQGSACHGSCLKTSSKTRPALQRWCKQSVTARAPPLGYFQAVMGAAMKGRQQQVLIRYICLKYIVFVQIARQDISHTPLLMLYLQPTLWVKLCWMRANNQQQYCSCSPRIISTRLIIYLAVTLHLLATMLACRLQGLVDFKFPLNS